VKLKFFKVYYISKFKDGYTKSLHCLKAVPLKCPGQRTKSQKGWIASKEHKFVKAGYEKSNGTAY
jgi:hypothetical protein